MSRHILLIQGHPDSSELHLCHALAGSYVQGALEAGQEVRRCELAALDFPLLRSQKDFDNGVVPEQLQSVQSDILWCNHMVLFFPLWAGDMPALLKGMLEQVFRPAFTGTSRNPLSTKALSGRSARVVVTMGMPALVYRWYFRAHSVKALERNMLGMVGIGPVRETLIGLTGDLSASQAQDWLSILRKLGAQGA